MDVQLWSVLSSSSLGVFAAGAYARAMVRQTAPVGQVPRRLSLRPLRLHHRRNQDSKAMQGTPVPEADRKRIREMAASGATNRDIARVMDLHEQTVSTIAERPPRPVKNETVKALGQGVAFRSVKSRGCPQCGRLSPVVPCVACTARAYKKAKDV